MSCDRVSLLAPRDLDRLRSAALSPRRAHADLPGIGGRIRCRPEDFEVEELPAYGADGQPGHLLLTLRKRAMNSEDALQALSRALKVPRPEIGLAGLKDREAVTTQWISLPQQALPRLETFSHPAITLGSPLPHSHKLRRGHLHGNRFVIVVRELACEIDEAIARARAILERLAGEGLVNIYGEQRFGRGGANIEVGLAALSGRGPRRGKADLIVSAGQSALFNLYVQTRAERGLLDTVLLGDVLQKRATGGSFVCEDPPTDQGRLDAGELVVTGPMFGSHMRGPSPGSPAAELEQEILEEGGIRSTALAKLGRKVPGTRRPLRVWPTELHAEPAPAVDELDPGLALRFVLPPGSYATVLLREIMG